MDKRAVVAGVICTGLFLLLLALKMINLQNQQTVTEPSPAKNGQIVETEPPAPVPGQNFYPTREDIMTLRTMEDLQQFLYTIDETAYVTQEDLDIPKFLSMDLSLDLRGNKPRVLIFHTHSQENYIDSQPGEVEDTIIGVGNFLAQLLVDRYNIPVVHDVGQYDIVNGKEDRSDSYSTMEPAVKSILEKYPSLEVLIDLHRDGIPDHMHLVTEVNGLPTAKLMLFNGITRLNENGNPVALPKLVNPYLNENLALSLQLQLAANELYPELMRRIYIKPYRYSLHLRPRSMLVEVGANTNTVEEAKNAMYPLAEIIVQVLDEP